MQESIIVLAALGGALVVLGLYHAAVVEPRLRRMSAALGTHDTLLGGGGAQTATDRLTTLERAEAELRSARGAAERRLDALERVAATEVPRVGFVRFDAFPDVGSELSYALALLNREGDGVVVSSIWSREETRTYGKAVTGFRTSAEGSREENDAIARARSVISA